MKLSPGPPDRASGHPPLLAAVSLTALSKGMHALRLFFQWPLVINQVTIAMWPSVVAIIVTLALAVALWRETRRMAG